MGILKPGRGYKRNVWLSAIVLQTALYIPAPRVY